MRFTSLCAEVGLVRKLLPNTGRFSYSNSRQSQDAPATSVLRYYAQALAYPIAVTAPDVDLGRY